MEPNNTPEQSQDRASDATAQKPKTNASVPPSEMAAPKKNRVLLPAVLAAVLLLVGGGVALSLLGTTEDPETVFNKYVEKSASLATFTQTFTTVGEDEAAEITIVANSDMSDPASPKTSADVKFKVNGTEGLGDLLVDAEFIVISDDVYVNYESFEAPDLSDEENDAFALVYGEGFELSEVFGITETNKWNLIDLKGATEFGSTENDPLSIGLLAASINTTLGPVPNGDFADNAAAVAKKVLASEVLTISFEDIELTDDNGTDVYAYSADVNSEKLFELSRSLAEEYSLSTSSIDIEEESADANYNAKITVDVDDYTPVRVELDDVKIEFSNFGDSFKIEKPL